MTTPSDKNLPRRSAVLTGVLIALVLSSVAAPCVQETEKTRFPGTSWQLYASPEEVGWSSEKLSTARAFYDDSGSDAFLVVFDGAVLVSWGDVSRRYMCHSVRKSLLSALIGIHVGEGKIDLDKTLEELGIDDEPPLTTEEKQARIIDLLQSRSGVFHTAAYETPEMKRHRPERDSKKPGEFWYYNNWDFNTLCTIFEQEVKRGIFDEFARRIANPLQMEDFRLMDTYYHLEKQHSIHPAYPFRMSARDMARFGLLFARSGKWPGGQIVPERWVEASRRAYSNVSSWEGWGYGCMWWVNTDETDRKLGMCAALGYGGHMIAVLPEEDLVLVNRSNTYLGKNTEKADYIKLIDMVLDARVSPPKARPRLVPLVVSQESTATERDVDLQLENYEASFQFDNEEVSIGTIPYVIGDMIGRTVRIEAGEGRLLMIDDCGQRFFLVPLSPVEFFVEDMQIPVFFELNDRGRPVAITLDASPAWKIWGNRIEASDRGGE